MGGSVDDQLKIRGGSRGRCPYCHDDCAPSDDNVVCNECLARHHRRCWSEGGERCSGCRSTVAAGAGSGRRVKLEAPPGRSAAAPPRRSASRRAPRPIRGASLERLPEEVRERLEAELDKGEELLWAGQPANSIALHVLAMLPGVLFGIPWTAFAIFWVVTATYMTLQAGLGPQVCMPLFGIPFVLVGLAMLSSPYWAWKGASRTGYMVTNRRVVACEANGWGTSVTRVYGPESVSSMARVERSDGSGDLVLDEAARGRKGRVIRSGLMNIPRVREVEALIREALQP